MLIGLASCSYPFIYCCWKFVVCRMSSCPDISVASYTVWSAFKRKEGSCIQLWAWTSGSWDSTYSCGYSILTQTGLKKREHFNHRSDHMNEVFKLKIFADEHCITSWEQNDSQSMASIPSSKNCLYTPTTWGQVSPAPGGTQGPLLHCAPMKELTILMFSCEC